MDRYPGLQVLASFEISATRASCVQLNGDHTNRDPHSRDLFQRHAQSDKEDVVSPGGVGA